MTAYLDAIARNTAHEMVFIADELITDELMVHYKRLCSLVNF